MLFSTPEVLLVDTSCILYRCCLSPEAGRISSYVNDSYAGPSFLLYQTLRMLLQTHRNPIFVLDGWPQHKVEMFKAYKAQRIEAREVDPDAERLKKLKSQLRTLILQSVPSIVAYRPDQEADDCIGSLAAQLSSQGVEVNILSNDKDIWQLIGPRVSVFKTGRQPEKITQAHLDAEFGCPPEKIPMFKAWMGDSSDNIPKVARIPSAGVVKMVNACSTLEECVDRAGEFFKLNGSVNWQERMREFLPTAKTSLQIATIDRKLEVPFAYFKPDLAPLQQIFEAYRIQSFSAGELYNELLRAQTDTLQLLNSRKLLSAGWAEVDRFMAR